MTAVAPPQSETTILLVDDDQELTDLVSRFLRDNGFAVSVLGDGESAVSAIQEHPPRLVILDLMLPGMDGLSVCRQVRPHYPGPILMLTALADDVDEVTGLEVGADDYLAKPVRPRVLLAHVRALLRRTEDAEKPAAEAPVQVEVGDLRVNSGTHEAHLGDQLIDLTSAEFELLWLLARHKGEVLSRERLHEETTRTPYDGLDRTVDLRISRLRKKLGDDPRTPRRIKTVRSRGYLLADR